VNPSDATVSQDIKVALTTRKSEEAAIEVTSMPERLGSELSRMKRNPMEFSLNGRVQCGLGCGKGVAYNLTHPKCTNAGTWVSGPWLDFL
jgi:hypothetical protein